MQDEIQPELHETEIECASGATFKVLSTKEELHTDVSSNNHPFFTGERKLMDTTGRVEKFRQKYDLSHLEDREAGAAKDDDEETAEEADAEEAAEESEDDSE